MKLDTNFVQSPRGALRAALIGVWACAVALFAAAGAYAWQAAAKAAELPQLRVRLAALERRAALPVALPPAAELRALQQRVAALNALAGGPRSALLPTLVELEARLPEPVWLRSVHYVARSGELSLVAEAAAAEPLTQFLLELERSPLYSQVMLVRQTPRDESVQFDLRMQVRR